MLRILIDLRTHLSLLIIYVSLVIINIHDNQKRMLAAIHGILLNANDAETCNFICIKCNATAVFANGHCECNFVDDSNKGIIIHLQIYLRM